MRFTGCNSVGVVMFALALLVFFPDSAGAQRASDDSRWQFDLVPYLWMAGMDGDVTVKGRKSSVDLTFGDLVENLDVGGMLHFEGSKGKWGFFTDLFYTRLSSDAKVGPVEVNVETEQFVGELGGMYRLGRWPLGGDEGRAVSLNVLGGGRYWKIKNEIEFARLPDVDASKEWLDPFVGLRLRIDVTKRLPLVLRGDIGGFDLGDTSDFSCNLFGGLGYKVSRVVTIWGGYRYLSVDYDTGSGSRRFAYDVTINGPVLGVGFSF